MRVTILLLLFIACSISCKRSYRGTQNSNVPESSNKVREDNREQQSIDSRYSQKSAIKNTEDITALFERLEKSVFMIYGRVGDEVFQASAFLIGSDIGISNFHFLRADLDEVKVIIQEDVYDLSDFLEYSPEEKLDYFIFQIEDYSGTPLKIARKRPKIGENVFAIGSPQGLSNSLTKGSISGYRANNRLQFDATIDHGSSGGPLFNYQGEVVGITSAGVESGKELNFAVDIQKIDLSRYLQ
ncbi:S1 family peptidase [Pareuzebyella sediminis]|uniref:S1 family peptidase n=1 Tax=Pareuzebyella sediminis TaxID=2607998 RepID=UPI0018E111EC|nr:serine protease [Pareuzebyella sediminis]